jgi:anti-sigma regulatory factor (Ser/Thr protein kinase)
MRVTSAWSHETVLPADAASAARARDFVCLHLAAHDLQYLMEDIRLVVSELASNAMERVQTPFTVVLSAIDHTVLLTVQDESPGVPTLVVAEETDIGGRGLFIVQTVSEDWGVAPGQNGVKSVWASFHTRPTGAGSDQVDQRMDA